MKKIFLVLPLVFILTACSTAYSPANFDGGYSSTMLAKDNYIVNFRGNEATSSEKTRDLALLRAAEIAIDNGYPYFVVLNGGTREKSYTSQIAPGNIQTNVYGSYGYNVANTTYNNPVMMDFSQFKTELSIKAFSKENAPSNALEAAYIVNEMKKKYKIKWYLNRINSPLKQWVFYTQNFYEIEISNFSNKLNYLN